MVFVPQVLGGTTGTERRGVVLLVVMALLALFAAVGLSFVFYADAEAQASLWFREASDIPDNQPPDYNVEALANFFLAQFLYDADDTNGVYSSMRGHSLARNMYGYQAGAVNCAAFSGLGRAHFNQTPAAIAGKDNFNLVNYTYYPSDSFIRDPERLGHRADNKAAQSNPFVASNVSYTYPDHNNMYLGAVNANWEVLLQSYSRPWLGSGRYFSLQPDPAWNDPTYSASLALDADGGGHVKNLENSPGTVYYAAGVKKYYKNDSYWMDLGFPIMVANGVKYKPLFAPLIIDLDGKLNLNAHGNIRGTGNNHASSYGLGPWEVSLARAMTNQPDLAKLFLGTTIGMKTYKGRYGPNGKAANGGPIGYPGSRYYSLLDLDGVINPSFALSTKFLLPGEGTNPNPGYYPWPYYDTTAYGDADVFERTDHPALFNALTAAGDDRIFDWTDQEALLRYGLKGSIGNKSELFQLYPNFTTIPRVRGLVGSKSFDVGRPGATGWLMPGDAAYVQYDWKSGDPYPMASASPFPSASFPATPAGEFGTGWSGVNIGLGKLDLNRALTDYPAVDATTGQITDTAKFNTATSDRQTFARDIFNRLRWVATGKDPMTAFPAKASAEWNALRWLAQLAVNIVDQRDSDDYITPFNWDTSAKTDEYWVYGTELPKLVLNESYVEVITDPADPLTMSKATMPYLVNFWVELLNPHKDDGAGTNTARLQIPAVGASPMVPSYKVTIAVPPGSGSPFTDQNAGTPDPTNTKLEVADFTPEGAPTPPPLAGVDVHVVLPANTNYAGTNGKNEGFYLLGSKYDFPSTAGATPTPPLATLRVKDQVLGGVRSAMTYTVPNTTNPTTLKYNVFLRRLACPYLPEQSNPANPNYNPYITVDYVQNVTARDGVNNDNLGVHTPTAIGARRSVGRKQPYAAHSSQQVDQDPSTANTNQPQHTFFRHNGREASAPSNSATLTQPFDWLVHFDRQLTSPVEIMQASAYMPYTLTQQFITGNAANQKYTHRAPWFDPASRIYRFFEFAEVGSRGLGVSTGGRIPGRMNINTMYGPYAGADTGDIEIFRGLTDPQTISSFSAADVDTIWQRLLTSRTGGGGTPGVPGSNGLNERPFKSLATGNIASGDPQIPLGSGIDDTLLRVDPVDNTKRLFEFNPAAGSNPHLKMELLNKIFNNVTTRSNVFAVWLTVGFFEVKDDSVKPAKLGAEIGRSTNKHIRHRIFALVDRTQFKLFSTTGKVTAADTIACTTTKIQGANGTTWNIQPGMLLEVDSGALAETVTVQTVAAGSFTATFTKTHAGAVPITCRGNPGPVSSSNPAVPAGTNPTYDLRQDSSVVTYFAVID